MSFDALERSNYGSKPVALYDFKMGTKVWRYCGGEREIEIAGNVYEPIPISDDGVRQSGDARNDDLKITLPRSVEFLGLFRGQPLSETLWVTLRRVQLDDATLEAPVIWLGSVTSFKLRGVDAELKCDMLTASFNRAGLRLSWSRQCPYSVYDRNCKVNKNNFAVTFQIESMTGVSITSLAIGAFGNGYFSYGFFEWELVPGVIERRAIESHANRTFNILGSSDGLQVGDWITAYPGCNLTTQNCAEKFNNLPNYGGVPHMPGKSPFDGHPVF